MHGGGLFGHYSNFHLFPDVKLGIYTNINGLEGQIMAMVNAALYIGMTD